MKKKTLKEVIEFAAKQARKLPLWKRSLLLWPRSKKV